METSFWLRRGLLASAAVFIAAAAVPASGGEITGAVAPVQHLVDGLLRVMKAGNSVPFGERFDVLAPVIDGTFDLNTILRESVGPSWEVLPSDQQQMLSQAFRRYTVASYVNSFNGYSGQRFEVKPAPRPVGNGEQVVQTEIVPTSGDGHELDYVMRQISGGWRAVDVLADGAVSRVAVQRSDFRRLLRKGGAQALAESLLLKSVDLSEGAS